MKLSAECAGLFTPTAMSYEDVLRTPTCLHIHPLQGVTSAPESAIEVVDHQESWQVPVGSVAGEGRLSDWLSAVHRGLHKARSTLCIGWPMFR